MYLLKHNQLVVVQYDLHPQVDLLKNSAFIWNNLNACICRTFDPKELVGLCSKYTQKILNMVA